MLVGDRPTQNLLVRGDFLTSERSQAKIPADVLQNRTPPYKSSSGGMFRFGRGELGPVGYSFPERKSITKRSRSHVMVCLANRNGRYEGYAIPPKDHGA